MKKKDFDEIRVITKDKERLKFIDECAKKIKSYLTKDELIDLLTKMDFKSCNLVNLELITDFIINVDDKDFRPLYKTIEIR